MYDWPEVRPATDNFWLALRDALRACGVEAPDTLLRRGTGGPEWTDPRLTLSQTCGMPYRLGLHLRVTLIGAPDYGVDGCLPGYYRSALVVRADDLRDRVDAYFGASFAFNETISQSGFAALTEALGSIDPELGLRTGSHRASIRAVASGKAEIAAIDAVSWRLAKRWEPAAVGVRQLGWTKPMPGLPMITAAGRDPSPYATAIGQAIEALATGYRRVLGLRGFKRFRPEDYLRSDDLAKA